MTNSPDSTPEPTPEPTPVYERPVDVEGQYPPMAGLRELRHLLNAAWKQQQLHGGAQARAQLAQAELMYRQAIDDEERRMGRLVGRDFDRQTVPLEYIDAYVRRNGQMALEEGRRQGREEINAEVARGLAGLQVLLNRIAELDDAPLSDKQKVQAALKIAGPAQVDRATEHLARIERAAYDRGRMATFDAAGVRDEINKVVDQAAEAQAKLEMIREILNDTNDDTELAAAAARVRAVLES